MSQNISKISTFNGDYKIKEKCGKLYRQVTLSVLGAVQNER